jgi:hypothetical protein
VSSTPAPSRDLKILPLAAARRGRPPIGFGLQVAEVLALEVPDGPGAPLARCRELSGTRTVGLLEVDVFAATLVMDPDRALAEVADRALERLRDGGVARARPPQSFDLDAGVHGVRLHADLLRDRAGARPPLPYVTIVAFAGPSVRGGVLVVARAAAEEWEAGERTIDSIQVLDQGTGGGRGGTRMPIATR